MAAILNASSKALTVAASVVGAAYVAGNERVKSFWSDLSGVFKKHLQEDRGSGDNGRATDAATAALTAQMKRLHQEMRQLAAAGRSNVTVVSGGSQGGVIKYTLVVVVAGASFYVYLWFKGLSISDFMYVTQRGMNQAVTSMQKAMDAVNSRLTQTRRLLSDKVDTVTHKVDDVSVKVQETSLKTDHVMGQVVEVHEDVRSIQGELKDNKQILEEVRKGMFLLCSFALNQVEGHGPGVGTLKGLREMRTWRSFSLPGPNGLGALLLENGPGSNGLSGDSAQPSPGVVPRRLSTTEVRQG